MVEFIKGFDGADLVVVYVNGRYLVESKYLNGYLTVFASYDRQEAVDYFNQCANPSF